MNQLPGGGHSTVVRSSSTVAQIETGAGNFLKRQAVVPEPWIYKPESLGKSPVGWVAECFKLAGRTRLTGSAGDNKNTNAGVRS